MTSTRIRPADVDELLEALGKIKAYGWPEHRTPVDKVLRLREVVYQWLDAKLPAAGKERT